MTVEELKISDERVSTGIDGLDDLIEGGFPRGSLILLAGSPGSGKTIASAQYLYHGATKLKEKGIYVSFAERRETFFQNMERFGFDFEILESKGNFQFLDMMTCSEETIGSVINMILGEVSAMHAKRLVIDSFSAMAQAFKKKIDARIIVHLLEKMMRQTDCTTLMLVEIPTGTAAIGMGIEEFVADGIILFETVEEKIGIRKRAIIRKMRGTNHNMNYNNIIISANGISLMPEVT
ncbi:MAG: AAA family ATPase [Candidatus Bathyarchaeota archaeon]|nr:AAA family ATPase [Candidatus Bathyarchaeota archaeon]MDH5787987.1 AAA family ATPase [Candidatus Bathyarchaeota archaeon]